MLAQRRGVCQDYAHLMIACICARAACRALCERLSAHDPTRRVAVLQGADASHAWVSVWCPPIGWMDFDPTNGVRGGLDHIALAWGRDFGDVSPLRGVILGGGQHTLTVNVDVVPQELVPQ